MPPPARRSRAANAPAVRSHDGPEAAGAARARQAPAGPNGSRSRIVAAVALAAVLILKLAVLAQLHDHPLLQPHGELDTAYYIDLARRIADRGLLGVAEPFFVSPLYVYFLAAVFAAGGSPVAAKVLQVVLGTAAVALVFLTAREWFGRRAAKAAAVLTACTGLFTFYEVLILQAALDPFLTAVSLWTVTRAAVTRRPAWMAGAGITLGLLALNRPNALAYAPVAALALAVTAAGQRDDGAGSAPAAPPVGASGAGRGRRAAALRALAAVALGLFAVLGLNAWRNYAASGEAIVVSSHGGLNFYIGNHAGADGTYSPVPGIRASIAGQATDSARVAEADLGRPASPDEVSAHFYRLGWQWIASRPGDALVLAGRKLAILVNRVNVPLNFSYAYFAGEPRALLRGLAVGPWLLFPLGLAGLLWPSLRQRRRGYWAWAAFVPVYGAAVAAFFVSSRYRVPLLIPLCAAAGAGIVRTIELLGRRRFQPLALPALIAALIAVPAFWNLGLDDGVDGEQTRRAVWLIEQGAFEQARAFIARIAPGQKRPGVLAYRVGLAYLDARRPEDAAESFRRAEALDGPQPAIRLPLGQALLEGGRPADAVAPLGGAFDAGYRREESGPLLVRALVAAGRRDEAVRLVASMPDDVAGTGAEAPLDFGTLALEQGAAGEAERWLRLAVARAPALAEASEKLGLALYLQGRPAEALPSLEAACRLAPASASAHLNLAAVLASLDRFAEARPHAAEAARLDPTERRAAALLEALSRAGR